MSAIKGRDPRSDFNLVGNSGNGQTGTNHGGGFIEVAVVDLGNGTGALAMISVTRSKTTAGPFSTSTQLLAADISRLAVSIQNTDATHSMYLGVNGATAVVGQGIVIGPNKTVSLPGADVQGEINAIWAAGATGGANLLATTA